MRGRIFINYRRGDQPGFAGRLYDRLEQSMPGAELFMDVDNIPAGADFVEFLDGKVGNCDILLAVIGDGWLGACNPDGTRRIDDEADFVAIEIASALKQGKLVIPVLIGNTPMVGESDLPLPLKALARRNAIRVTHERFRSDVEGLVRALKSELQRASEAAALAGRKERSPARDVGAAFTWFGAAILFPRLWSMFWGFVTESVVDRNLTGFLLMYEAHAAANFAPSVALAVWLARARGRMSRLALAIAAIAAVLSISSGLQWIPQLMLPYWLGRAVLIGAASLAGICAGLFVWTAAGTDAARRKAAWMAALLYAVTLLALVAGVPYSSLALGAGAVVWGIATRRLAHF